VLVDANGALALYQITNYLENSNRNPNSGCCSSSPPCGQPCIHVNHNPGLSDDINPPGGQPNLVQPITMNIGVRFRTFRVRDGWLEQKEGLFDPNTDNPGNAFFRVLPDVDDLQVAWVYPDGSVWNTTTQQLPNATYPNSVPTQGAGTLYDVHNVIGLRVSITARSSGEVYWETESRFVRPASEDHAAPVLGDRFYHHRITDLVMIRNRNLQW
jgi:hypothetical protein